MKGSLRILWSYLLRHRLLAWIAEELPTVIYLVILHLGSAD